MNFQTSSLNLNRFATNFTAETNDALIILSLYPVHLVSFSRLLHFHSPLFPSQTIVIRPRRTFTGRKGRFRRKNSPTTTQPGFSHFSYVHLKLPEDFLNVLPREMSSLSAQETLHHLLYTESIKSALSRLLHNVSFRIACHLIFPRFSVVSFFFSSWLHWNQSLFIIIYIVVFLEKI